MPFPKFDLEAIRASANKATDFMAPVTNHSNTIAAAYLTTLVAYEHISTVRKRNIERKSSANILKNIFFYLFMCLLSISILTVGFFLPMSTIVMPMFQSVAALDTIGAGLFYIPAVAVLCAMAGLGALELMAIKFLHDLFKPSTPVRKSTAENLSEFVVAKAESLSKSVHKNVIKPVINNRSAVAAVAGASVLVTYAFNEVTKAPRFTFARDAFASAAKNVYGFPSKAAAKNSISRPN